MSSTDVDEVVEIDVDLDKTIPCDGDGCPNSATWRLRWTHLDLTCLTKHTCDRCKTAVKLQLEWTGPLVCLEHQRILRDTWTRL